MATTKPKTQQSAISRFWGGTREPDKTPDEHLQAIDESAAKLHVRLGQANKEAADAAALYKKNPRNNMYKTMARQKMNQRNQIMAQLINLGANSAQLQTVQSVQQTADIATTTLKVTQTAGKQMAKAAKQLERLNVDKIMDDMAENKALLEEIQESMSRTYDLDAEYTEEDFEAELDAMATELENEQGQSVAMDMPDFGEQELPTFIDEPPDKSKIKETAA